MGLCLVKVPYDRRQDVGCAITVPIKMGLKSKWVKTGDDVRLVLSDGMGKWGTGCYVP
jgi:hypothetical protein